MEKLLVVKVETSKMNSVQEIPEVQELLKEHWAIDSVKVEVADGGNAAILVIQMYL